MPTAMIVLAVFIALIGASALGAAFQQLLGEHHKSRETGENVRLIISVLITFTAILLGLILSNVKSSFDLFDSRLRSFSGDLTQLDVRLREYGAEAEPIRAKTRAYLAAAIADTWSREPHPPGAFPRFNERTGVERLQLGEMLVGVDVAIRKLSPADSYHSRLATQLEERMGEALAQRRLLIETARDTISWPLLTAMTVWLAIVFAVFGLIAPRNMVIYTTIGVCALSFASAIFFIVEFDTPLDGYIHVSSASPRDALSHMDAP